MPIPNSSKVKLCPRCQSIMPPGSTSGGDGLCRACLLLVALDPASGELELAPDSDSGGIVEALNQRSTGVLSHSFGDYELVKEIARGGMGVVFHAYQISLKRKVAIKFIRSERLESEDARRRFRLESETAAGLEHPNIVPVYEVGEHEDCPYLSMKLIEGEDLSARIRSGSRGQSPICGKMPQPMFMAKIARAVHYAHGRGVLHRDLKPSNILIDENGEPYVTDFGLAKLADTGGDMTRSAAMLGTPRYMSPDRAYAREL
jgi:serine/threonine protein kinase